MGFPIVPHFHQHLVFTAYFFLPITASEGSDNNLLNINHSQKYFLKMQLTMITEKSDILINPTNYKIKKKLILSFLIYFNALEYISKALYTNILKKKRTYICFDCSFS